MCTMYCRIPAHARLCGGPCTTPGRELSAAAAAAAPLDASSLRQRPHACSHRSSMPDDSFNAKFFELVDAWLEAHPVTTNSLSPDNVRFAVANVLILKSGRGGKLKWPGAHPDRLAATLIVLLAAGLAGEGSDGAECKVLGFGVKELFEITRDLVRTASITRERLGEALFEVDEDGSASFLAQSPEFHAALYGNNRKVQLVASWMPRAQSVSAVALIALAFLDSLPELPAWAGRTAIICMHFTLLAVATAAIFPDPSSKVAVSLSRHAFTVAVSCTITAALTAYRDLQQQRHNGANAACVVLHCAFFLGITINCCAVTLRCWRGDITWHLGRACYARDGALVIATTLALRVAGPPAAYPPGSVSFESACARGLCTLLLAVVLGPSNRKRLAWLAGMLGGGSLALSLRQSYVKSMSTQLSVHSLHEATHLAVGQTAQSAVCRQLARRYHCMRFTLVLACSMWLVFAECIIGINYMPNTTSNATHPNAATSNANATDDTTADDDSTAAACAAAANDGVMVGAPAAPPSSLVPVQWMPYLSGTSLLLGMSLLASIFPHDLNSEVGRSFLLPVTITCTLCVFLTNLYSFAVTGAVIHVNTACAFAHAAHMVLLVGTWVTSARLCALGRGTWGMVRITLVTDGSCYCVVAVALRALGPPLAYPPRNGSFTTAVTRGLIVVGIAALLSPANRDWLAALAHRFGWNHVILSLNQLRRTQRYPRRVHFRTPLEGADADVDRTSGEASSNPVPSDSASLSGMMRNSSSSARSGSNYDGIMGADTLLCPAEPADVHSLGPAGCGYRSVVEEPPPVEEGHISVAPPRRA